MKITEHFSLEEFSVSAAHPDLVRPVPTELQGYVRLLCMLILEPWRVQYGSTFQVLSGYRPLQLNAKIDGSKTSQHVFAQAADITCRDTLAAYRMLMARARAGQCHGIGQAIYYPSQNFIHVAIASDRYQKFSAFVCKKSKVYTPHELTDESLDAVLSNA